MNQGQEFRKFAVHHLGLNGLTVDGYVNHTIENMTRAVIEERPMNFREVDVFFAADGGPDYFYGHRRRRQHRQHCGGSVAVSGIGRSQERHSDVHQQPRRFGVCRFGYLRHHAVRPARRGYGLHEFGRVDGGGVLAGGAAGKRSALPHARVMIHQPSGGAQGQSVDIEITAREIVKLREELYAILANHTGKTPEQIDKDSDRDNWFRAEEAKEYGLIDEVLRRDPSK